MTTATCSTCPYFDPEPGIEGRDDGYCRIAPPVPLLHSELEIVFGFFPTVAGGIDWCSRHPDRNVLGYHVTVQSTAT